MLNPIAFPKEFLFENYITASRIAKIFLAMGNSTIYVVCSLALVNVGAFTTSYFFSRYEFKGKKFISSVYLAGMLIPMYALMVPVFIQYKMLGLLNNRLALVITYFAMQMPLAIFLYRSFIDGVPRELDDAATIDGCTILQRLSRIVFPLCRPIIGTVSILTLIGVWNEFAFSVVLTPKTNLRTVAVAVRSFSSDIKVEYTLQFAGLCMVTLPIIIIYFIFSKEIINGMTAGAVKG
jgi:raffinose/stachyose/melibiose transport system permease protein